MTIDEAIKNAEEVAEISQAIADNTDYDNWWMDIAQCEKCVEEHRQLAEWLKELKQLKEQKPCEDAISRHAVLDLTGKSDWFESSDDYNDFVCAVCNLPSVTPQRWIPVSERLPEVDGEYLVTRTTTVKGLIGEYIDVVMYANDLYKIDEFDFSDKQGAANWYNYNGEYGNYEVDNVIAWMPLPEPYKAESEETDADSN